MAIDEKTKITPGLIVDAIRDLISEEISFERLFQDDPEYCSTSGVVGATLRLEGILREVFLRSGVELEEED